MKLFIIVKVMDILAAKYESTNIRSFIELFDSEKNKNYRNSASLRHREIFRLFLFRLR